jgi:hypothetical protein
VELGGWAVPVRDTDCGLPVALSVKTTLPTRVPEALVGGEKVTVMPQLADAARVDGEAGHVFEVMAKSPAFAPVTAMLDMVTAAVPVLCTVKLSGLELPSVTVGNTSEDGLNERVVFVLWPVPLNGTDWGLPVALSVIDRDAVRVPRAEGEKVMLTEHDELTAKVAGDAGQVLPEML